MREILYRSTDELNLNIADVSKYLKNESSIDILSERKMFVHVDTKGYSLEKILARYLYEKLKEITSVDISNIEIKDIEENIDIFFEITVDDDSDNDPAYFIELNDFN